MAQHICFSVCSRLISRGERVPIYTRICLCKREGEGVKGKEKACERAVRDGLWEVYERAYKSMRELQ